METWSRRCIHPTPPHIILAALIRTGDAKACSVALLLEWPSSRDHPQSQPPLKAERAEMMIHVGGGKTLPKEIADQIVDRIDGVPLFIEEPLLTLTCEKNIKRPILLDNWQPIKSRSYVGSYNQRTPPINSDSRCVGNALKLTKIARKFPPERAFRFLGWRHRPWGTMCHERL